MHDPVYGRALVVFARAPEIGRVKTRLAADVGTERALTIYRELGGRVLEGVRGLPDCELVVAYTPEGGGETVREWLGGDVRLEPQSGDDLGARMLAAITQRTREGAERVVVIGTDCPSVDGDVVEHAFARLDSADVVLGPATDGGYYLIGMTRPRPEIFRDVPWSSPETLAITLERAEAHGLSVALLEERRDIDTIEDWRAWRAGRADQSTSRGR